MSSSYLIKRNDTYDSIVFKVPSSFDMEGATTRFLLSSSPNSKDKSSILVNSDNTIYNKDTGEVAYQLRDGDTSLVGRHFGEFQITFSDKRVQSFPTGKNFIIVEIVDSLDSSRMTWIEDNYADEVALRVSKIEEFKEEIREEQAEFIRQFAQENEAFKQSIIALNDGYRDIFGEAAAYARAQGEYALGKGMEAEQRGLQAKEQGNYAQEQGLYAETQTEAGLEMAHYAREQGDYAKHVSELAEIVVSEAGDMLNTLQEEHRNTEEKGTFAKEQGNFAKEQGDYAKAQAEELAPLVSEDKPSLNEKIMWFKVVEN
ncbi:hypothetical protein P8825_14485 [Shouchella clausii]|uniref:hypothetical protein n=1 Tax=Shouchella clausii TaxID=79880 RepID=UPI002DBDE232|nr:hypothetical protein [Shouchella clausii]MEB5480772.1 hypothetical protein [Shouchella clausii]